MVVQAANSEVVAEGGGARPLLSISGGYQMADYSLGNSKMGVAGVYLGAGTSVLADWLDFEMSLGYRDGIYRVRWPRRWIRSGRRYRLLPGNPYRSILLVLVPCFNLGRNRFVEEARFT